MIYKIKRGRDVTITGFPFTVFYIVPASKVKQFQRGMPSFMGFQLRHAPWPERFTGVPLGCVVNSITLPPQAAQDCPLDNTEYARLYDVIPDLLRAEDPWHLIVPILSLNSPRTEHKKKRARRAEPEDLYGEPAPLVPRDTLGAAPAFLTRDAGTDLLPSTVYFAAGGVIHPFLCAACARYPHHLNGECRIGDSVCYTALRGYDAPSLVGNILKLSGMEGK